MDRRRGLHGGDDWRWSINKEDPAVKQAREQQKEFQERYE